MLSQTAVGLLQDRDLDRPVRDQPLETRVLDLQLLQPTRLLGLHPALLAPTSR